MDFTSEQKERLFSTSSLEEFGVVSREIYGGTMPLSAFDLDIGRHFNSLCKKSARESGENLQIPSDPRQVSKMSERKLFSDSRWNDTGKPNIIGHFERTDEERMADKKRFREHLKKIGVIKDGSEE